MTKKKAQKHLNPMGFSDAEFARRARRHQANGTPRVIKPAPKKNK